MSGTGIIQSTSVAAIPFSRIKSGLRITAAAAFVLTLTAVSPPVALAQDINIGAQTACTPTPLRVRSTQILAFLRGNGYKPVGRLQYHRRLFPISLPNAQRCGFVRAMGEKGNVRYAIYFNGNGQRLGRRRLGAATSGGATGKVLTQQQVRAGLTARGWTNIQKLRRTGPATAPIYTAEGNRGRNRFQLWVDGKTGQVKNVKPIAASATVLTPAQIRTLLTRRGLTNVRKLRRTGTAANPVYTAEGDRSGRSFAMRIDGKTGRILNARPIASAPAALTLAQVVSRLRSQGFSNFKKMRRTGPASKPMWVGEAVRRGQRFQILADGRTGRLTNSRRIGPAATPGLTQPQVEARLRSQGFRNFKKMRKIGPPAKPMWVGEAERRGQRFQILADGRTGRLTNSRRIGPAAAPGLTQPQVEARLRSQGFRNFKKMRKIGPPTKPMWVGEAERRGQRFQILADGKTGRLTNSRRIGPVATPGLTLAQMRAKLVAAGYKNIVKLAKRKFGTRTLYSGEAERRGRRFSIIARVNDGRILRQRDIGPAGGGTAGATILTPAQVRARLSSQGFNPIHKITKLGPRNAGDYQVEADRAGSRWIMNVKAATGNIWFRKRLGPATTPPAKNLTVAQMRAKLRTDGFLNIKNFRTQRRGARIFYTAEAERAGRRFQIVARASDGKYNARNVGPAPTPTTNLTVAQMRAKLRTDGFLNIKNFRTQRRGARIFYTAEAERAGRRFQIVARASDGKYNARNVGPAPTPTTNLTAAQMRAKLTADGFTKIVKFRSQRRGARVFYTAEAERAGRRFSILARASDGKYRSRDIGPAPTGPGTGGLLSKV